MGISKSRATVRMNTHITPELKEQLHVLAAAERRSLANLVEETLEEKVKAGPRERPV